MRLLWLTAGLGAAVLGIDLATGILSGGDGWRRAAILLYVGFLMGAAALMGARAGWARAVFVLFSIFGVNSVEVLLATRAVPGDDLPIAMCVAILTVLALAIAMFILQAAAVWMVIKGPGADWFRRAATPALTKPWRPGFENEYSGGPDSTANY
jgi:hypothetical protein